jgi:hypothetical protein
MDMRYGIIFRKLMKKKVADIRGSFRGIKNNIITRRKVMIIFDRHDENKTRSDNSLDKIFSTAL